MIRPTLIAAVAALAIAPATLMASSVVNATYNGMKYRVYLPDSYTTNGPDIPVTLYLHSAAERGDSVDAVFSGGTWTNTWIDDLLQETQHGTHQSIVVIPESGWGQVWSSPTAGDNWTVGNYTGTTSTTTQLSNAVQITKNVINQYNSDSKRVYVTGPSMGGYGTWEAVAKNPTLFAAAVPLSGAGNTDLAKTVLATKPVWAFTGGQDSLIPASNTVGMYFAMKQAGGSPVISYLADVGHGGWDEFYAGTYTLDKPSASGGVGQDVYDWLFSQSLDKPNTLNAGLKPGTSRVVITFGADNSSVSKANITASSKDFVAYNLVGKTNLSKLVDANNFQTTISINRLSSNTILKSSVSYGLTGTIADETTADAAGGQKSSSNLIYQITGLDDSKLYRFDILGTTNGANATEIVNVLYQLVGNGTRTATLNVANNDDQYFSVSDLRSINGIVTLTVFAPKSDFATLSSIVITQVPEPATMSLLAMGAVGLLRRRRNAH